MASSLAPHRRLPVWEAPPYSAAWGARATIITLNTVDARLPSSSARSIQYHPKGTEGGGRCSRHATVTSPRGKTVRPRALQEGRQAGPSQGMRLHQRRANQPDRYNGVSPNTGKKGRREGEGGRTEGRGALKRVTVSVCGWFEWERVRGVAATRSCAEGDALQRNPLSAAHTHVVQEGVDRGVGALPPAARSRPRLDGEGSRGDGAN